jgi:putative ABC transport system permease protein
MSSPLKKVVRRMRVYVRSDEVRLEIDEELQFHIDMRTQENLRAGLAPEEARANALERFGDYEKIKQDCYAIGGDGLLKKIGVRAACLWY